MILNITQRVDGQLRDPVKVLTAEEAIVALVQRGEATVEPLNLVGCEARLLLDGCNLVLPQHQRRSVAHVARNARGYLGQGCKEVKIKCLSLHLLLDPHSPKQGQNIWGKDGKVEIAKLMRN